MVRDTSVKTYRQLLAEGVIGIMCEKLLVVIRENPNLSDTDYSNITGYKINQITGRRNDLMQMGLVVKSGEKIDVKTGQEVTTWKAPKKFNFKKKIPIRCKHCRSVVGYE